MTRSLSLEPDSRVPAKRQKSSWIEVRNIRSHAGLKAAQVRFGLGAGELSTMLLASEVRADLIVLDDLAARRLAQNQGFKVQGADFGKVT